VLWVDAVCINQKWNEERTHQVNLMGEIYLSCTNVIVYLGNELCSTAAAGPRHTGPLIQHISAGPDGVITAEEILQDNSALGVTRKKTYGAAHVFTLIKLLSQDRHLTEIPLFSDSGQENGLKRTKLVEAVRQLMHSPWTPWWSRIWVVQEVILPKNVIVSYGTVTAD
jgi:hypothetical protein